MASGASSTTPRGRLPRILSSCPRSMAGPAPGAAVVVVAAAVVGGGVDVTVGVDPPPPPPVPPPVPPPDETVVVGRVVVVVVASVAASATPIAPASRGKTTWNVAADGSVSSGMSSTPFGASVPESHSVAIGVRSHVHTPSAVRVPMALVVQSNAGIVPHAPFSAATQKSVIGHAAIAASVPICWPTVDSGMLSVELVATPSSTSGTMPTALTLSNCPAVAPTAIVPAGTVGGAGTGTVIGTVTPGTGSAGTLLSWFHHPTWSTRAPSSVPAGTWAPTGIRPSSTVLSENVMRASATNFAAPLRFDPTGTQGYGVAACRRLSGSAMAGIERARKPAGGARPGTSVGEGGNECARRPAGGACPGSSVGRGPRHGMGFPVRWGWRVLSVDCRQGQRCPRTRHRTNHPTLRD